MPNVGLPPLQNHIDLKTHSLTAWKDRPSMKVVCRCRWMSSSRQGLSHNHKYQWICNRLRREPKSWDQWSSADLHRHSRYSRSGYSCNKVDLYHKEPDSLKGRSNLMRFKGSVLPQEMTVSPQFRESYCGEMQVQSPEQWLLRRAISLYNICY